MDPGAGHGGAASSLRSVDDVYNDFVARREGIVKALMHDVEMLYQMCDPERDNLCLYGHSDGSWEVALPAEEVPPELPEPALGINFARDGMQRKDWLSLVAVHSDSWLLAVASYYGARFDKQDRKRLFSMICDLPTVFDVVSGRTKKEPVKKKKPAPRQPQAAKKAAPATAAAPKQDMSEEEEEEDATLCGVCQGEYGANEFWIMCDQCDIWYHGKCVKITPARAEHIKNYKCPACSKRQRTF
eukprot:jgi/Mesvir1/4501/Mv03781-RA.1